MLLLFVIFAAFARADADAYAATPLLIAMPCRHAAAMMFVVSTLRCIVSWLGT